MPRFGHSYEFYKYQYYESRYFVSVSRQCQLLGSCNGLVCISPINDEVLVPIPTLER